MEKVTLFPVLHRGSEQILICFSNLNSLNNAVRRIPAVKWSLTHKSWYLPLSKENCKLIAHTLGPLTEINCEALQHYLSKRKAVKASEVPEAEFLLNPLPVSKPVPISHPVIVSPEPTAAYRLSYENLINVQKTVGLLVLKAYSHSTIRTYRGELILFFQVLGKHPAGSLTTEDVKRWLLKCLKEGLSENTMHSRINALKFFYEQVLGREKFFWIFPGPKSISNCRRYWENRR